VKNTYGQTKKDYLRIVPGTSLLKVNGFVQ
jgi:hypothetical protein